MVNNKTRLMQRFVDIKQKFSSIIKGFAWFVLTLFAGLFLPMLIIVVHFLVSFEGVLYKKLVIEGGILSFSIAMVSSLIGVSKVKTDTSQVYNAILNTIKNTLILMCYTTKNVKTK